MGSVDKTCSDDGKCSCKGIYDGAPSDVNNAKCKLAKAFEEIRVYVSSSNLGPSSVKLRLYDGKGEDGKNCLTGLKFTSSLDLFHYIFLPRINQLKWRRMEISEGSGRL